MRDLRAALSSDEEITLRRIAIGSVLPHKLPAEHLKRLTRLGLIEANKDAYRLTPLGRQRYNGLPRAARLATDGPAEIEQILSNVMRSKQGKTGGAGLRDSGDVVSSTSGPSVRK